MSFTRYLLHDFWTAREFNSMEEERGNLMRKRRLQRADQRHEAEVTNQRIAELEDDLGQATLLLRALTDLVLKKGLVTAGDLFSHAAALDAQDGVVDGKMKPAKAPRTEPPAEPSAERPDPPRPRRRPRA